MNARPTLLLPLAALFASLGLHAEPVGKSYAPGPFDSLSFGGSAVVQFRQGERDEIFIEGDESVQRSVSVELRGSELVLRSDGSWKFWTSRSRLRVQVQMRELKSLRVSGAADFVAAEPVSARALSIGISGAGVARFEQLRARELRFSVSGSGDGHFGGSVDELSVNISGRSDFYGEQLHSRLARVSISGLGKARVWCTGELSTSISGIGTVDYWGNPSVQKRSSGVSSHNNKGAKPAPTAGASSSASAPAS